MCIRDSGSLRGVDFKLVWLRLDREQRRAFFHEVAVLVADRLDKALHARDEIDRVDGSRISGRVKIACDVLLDGRSDGDLRRRRCGVLIVLTAGGDTGNREKQRCTDKPSEGHGRTF